MLSVLALSAAAQIEVELQFGGVGEPIYIVDEPQSVFPTGLNELMGMVEQMQLSQQQPYQMMQNPCTNVSATLSNHGRTLTISPPPPQAPGAGPRPVPSDPSPASDVHPKFRRQDQVRFGCGPDAACLKAHLSQLSPSCAMFLLKSTTEARPSPSPAPMEAVGFYSSSYLGQDGQMYLEEGQISPREGKMFRGEMQGVMDLVMSEFFGQPQPQPRSAPSPRPSTSAHPCDAEVTKCKDQLNGVTLRVPMQKCLVENYEKLSSGCKCFLHQVMGQELEQAVPAAKSSADPRVPAVAIAEGRLSGSLVFLREAGNDDVPPPFAVENGHPPPGHHRFTCALFMTLFFLSVFLVLRRVISMCCAPAKPRFAAVVPPQQRVQLSVEPLVAKITTTKM